MVDLAWFPRAETRTTARGAAKPATGYVRKIPSSRTVRGGLDRRTRVRGFTYTFDPHTLPNKYSIV